MTSPSKKRNLEQKNRFDVLRVAGDPILISAFNTKDPHRKRFA